MNDGFRILERSNALFRIHECPEYFVRLSLFMNNGTKDRTNYSGYPGMIHSIFGYPEAMNVGFRILKRSNKIFGILKYTGYFVRP